MKKHLEAYLLTTLLSVVFAAPVHAQGTSFTYQGRLTHGGGPATGSYDLLFTLYEDATGDSVVGTSLESIATPVTDGLFCVTLDFGSGIFTGQQRFLEVSVRPGGSTDAYETLAGRQALTATPYASFAGGVDAAGLIGTIAPANFAAGSIRSEHLAPGAVNHLDAPDGSLLNALQVGSDGLVGVGIDTPTAGLHIETTRSGVLPEVLFQVQDESPPYTSLAHASSVAVSGNLLAIGSPYNDAVTLVDISDPAQPVMRATLKDEENGFDALRAVDSVAMEGNLLAIASPYDNAVTLVGVADPGNPVRLAVIRDGVGGFDDLGFASSVALSGGLLAISAEFGAVTLVDVSNPALPLLKSVIKEGQFGITNLEGFDEVVMDGNLLAIASSYTGATDPVGAVTLMNVDDPANPVLRATLRDGEGGFTKLRGIEGLALSDHLLAIASPADQAVTLVLDEYRFNTFTKLAELSEADGGLDSLLWPVGVAISSGRLAISAGFSHAVTLFDISTPSAPKLMTAAKDGVGRSTLLKGAAGVAFAGDNLVVAAEEDSAFTILGFPLRETGFVSDGWAGIGTTRPLAPLHVVGDVIVEKADYFSIYATHLELGLGTSASGIASIAMGDETEASGFASIATGSLCKASGEMSTAMGYETKATGERAATAFGYGSAASGYASTAMGSGTEASAYASTAMGDACVASGKQSTAMGFFSTAAGDISLAAGYGAKALHNGTFVWADSSAPNFSSIRENEFAVCAVGGVRIQSNRGISLNASNSPIITRTYDPFTTGNYEGTGRWGLFMEPHRLVAGIPAITGKSFRVSTYNADSTINQDLMSVDQAGTVSATAFNPTSDREAKENFAECNPGEVLDKVVALPLTRWNFKQDPGTEHLGPMAQDFHAAFGVGTDNRHIATVDADGVALAAIQGLNEKLEKRDAEIAELKQRLARLEALILRNDAN